MRATIAPGSYWFTGLLRARFVALAAIGASGLLGISVLAVAGAHQRSPRDISGFWMQYPFVFQFDPTLKFGEPQRVVLQPDYEARYQAYVAAVAKGEAEGKPVANASSQCLPSGLPASMGGFAPLEFVITKKTLYAFPEGWDPPRRIFMARSLPPWEDVEPSYEGYSVGRWEGNTLVVDTEAVKIRTTIDGVPHSEAMKVHERIRLLDDDTLEDVFTITDPKAFKAPWVITKHYKDYETQAIGDANKPGQDLEHPKGKGGELVPEEVVCVENNRNTRSPSGTISDGVAPRD
ncbi:MAG: hypothetical protein WA825_07425 [Steroidobacteraceae bacterium]